MRDSVRLHPDLQVYLAFGLYQCYQSGLNVRITETYRTVEEQDNFYKQGASQVRGVNYGSMHQWGVAFDVCRNDGTGAYDFNGWIEDVAKIFKGYGLAWGGDWTGFVDKPHFQMKKYEDAYGGTGALKRSYTTPYAFMKKWKNSYLSEQFADLNISAVKALLDSKFTVIISNCTVWRGVKTLKKKDSLKKGTVVYIIKDCGDGRSYILYLKGTTICTGYVYNFKLKKQQSKFPTVTLAGERVLYNSKYNGITKKVLKGGKTSTVLSKGTKAKSIIQNGNWIKIRVKVNGKWKIGWIKK